MSSAKYKEYHRSWLILVTKYKIINLFIFIWMNVIYYLRKLQTCRMRDVRKVELFLRRTRMLAMSRRCQLFRRGSAWNPPWVLEGKRNFIYYWEMLLTRIKLCGRNEMEQRTMLRRTRRSFMWRMRCKKLIK